jgi:ABC-type nitrate/sulfonate/bicarbonate transport system substrate-binding protein
MSARTCVARLVTVLLVTAGASQAADAQPLRIGYLTWVGNGPFFVAQETGLFGKEGVKAT